MQIFLLFIAFGKRKLSHNSLFFWFSKDHMVSPYMKVVSETHMGRVQDMVTGLLNGSSSMKPLFFKSRGVGFAVENRKKHLCALNNGEIFMNNCKIKHTHKKNVFTGEH